MKIDTKENREEKRTPLKRYSIQEHALGSHHQWLNDENVAFNGVTLTTRLSELLSDDLITLLTNVQSSTESYGNQLSYDDDEFSALREFKDLANLKRIPHAKVRSLKQSRNFQLRNKPELFHTCRSLSKQDSLLQQLRGSSILV